MSELEEKEIKNNQNESFSVPRESIERTRKSKEVERRER